MTRRLQGWSLVAAVFTVMVGAAFSSGEAQAATPREYLVLSVTWQAAEGTPASPPRALGPEFAELTHTDAYYRTVSHGKHPGFTFVKGPDEPIAIPAPVRSVEPGQRPVCGTRFYQQLQNSALAVASQRGVDVNRFEHFVFLYVDQHEDLSREICANGGVAINGDIYIEGVDGSAVHEFGHTLGLDHAYLLTCDGGARPLSNSCTEGAYDDPYDAMSEFFFDPSFSAMFLDELGWLDGLTATCNNCGQITRDLVPIAAPGDSGLRAIKLIDGTRTFWLEYRQQVGVDAEDGWGPGADFGLVVHLRSDIGSETHKRQYLLDMKPGAPGFSLEAGQTWANPLGTMKIRVNEAEPNRVNVTVGTQKVPVPDVRGMTVSAASNAIRAAGLVVGQQGSTIDPTCNFINLVMSTQPGTGTLVMPGTTVGYRVGARDPVLGCK